MRVASRVRVLFGLTATLVGGACGEGPMAPPRLSAEAVAQVLPVVFDARLRLVEGIITPAVRARATADLQQIELALVRHDARAAAFRTRLLRSLLTEYASRSGSDHEDAADVVAIGLAINELAGILSLTADISLIQ